MANFSTNQVSQFYVYDSSAHNMEVKASKDKKQFFLTYVGAKGKKLRTDLIDTDKILYTKTTAAKAMQVPMKKFTLKLNSTVNGGNPVKGQVYTINIRFTPYQGFGDEDYLIKAISVQAKDAVPTNFWKAVEKEIKASFNEFQAELIKVAASGAQLTITTLPQTDNWVLGESPLEFVNLDISSVPVVIDGIEEGEWLDPTSLVPAKDSVVVKNGYGIADQEYFCMGERGDQYRMSGYPNVIRTPYLVDPTKEYDVLDIHYYFSDSKEGVQKSEKDLIIVAASGAKMLDTLIQAINTGTGLTIDKLPME